MATDVPQLLTVKELAKKLGRAKWAIYEMIERGESPPHFRRGKVIQFAEDAVVQWIREQEKKTAAAEAAE